MAQHAMTRGELMNLLTKEAKRYRRQALALIKRHRHMNNLSRANFLQLEKNQQLTQRVIDALLVDFINTVGIGQCADYALYTKYLKSRSADRT